MHVQHVLSEEDSVDHAVADPGGGSKSGHGPQKILATEFPLRWREI